MIRSSRCFLAAWLTKCYQGRLVALLICLFICLAVWLNGWLTLLEFCLEWSRMWFFSSGINIIMVFVVVVVILSFCTLYYSYVVRCLWLFAAIALGPPTCCWCCFKFLILVAGNNISLGIFNLTTRTIYVGMS